MENPARIGTITLYIYDLCKFFLIDDNQLYSRSVVIALPKFRRFLILYYVFLFYFFLQLEFYSS